MDFQSARNGKKMSEELSYDRLTTSSQRPGFPAHHPAMINDKIQNDRNAVVPRSRSGQVSVEA